MKRRAALAAVLLLLPLATWAQEEAGSKPGIRSRLEAWQNSQTWSSEASYSAVAFDEEAFETVFGRDRYSLLRFGGAWYPVRNLSLGCYMGGMYESGQAVGEITGEESGEDLELYVLPAQLTLRYELNFLEDQFFVPSVFGGGDWWYFQETSSFEDNVDGDKSGYHWGADLGILLDAIDPGAAHVMKRDWGVSDTYLTVGYEYLTVGEDEDGLEFSGELYSVGLKFSIGGGSAFE